MKLLLHACCGPCSLEPTRMLTEAGVEFAIDYTNPNIHPADEYEHRLQTLREYVAEPGGIQVVETPYETDEWERVAGVRGTDRKSRCRACYRMRFEQVASNAQRLGFDTIGTTLTISPYQYTSIILEELERAAEAHGLQAQLRDYSSHYDEATRRSIELGMYRQNYCGCRFSIAEAAAEREQRKAERKMRKKLARLERDVVGRVKERQLTKGCVPGEVRLRYEAASMCAIMHLEACGAEELASTIAAYKGLLSEDLRELAVDAVSAGEVEVVVSAATVEHIHLREPDPAFLASLIALLSANPRATREEIEACFAAASHKYVLEELPLGSEFAYSVRFKNPQIDAYVYCFAEQAGFISYRRFAKEDYERLLD